VLCLLVLACLVVWKMSSLMIQEIDTYSRIEALVENHNRLRSQCSSFNKRSDHSEVQNDEQCLFGHIRSGGVCMPCPVGTFSLPGWIACAANLDCEDIQLRVIASRELYSTGGWSMVYGDWEGNQVLIAHPIDAGLSWDPAIITEVTQGHLHPIGHCADSETMLFTPSSNVKAPLSGLDSLLIKNTDCNNWIVRFKLAMDYLEVLLSLHSAPSGPVVICNSQTMDQLIAQLALTQHWELFLTAFTSLVQRRGDGLVKCGQMEGELVAPEQRWPWPGTKVFNIDLQPGYSEAADVWKIPDISKHLLGGSRNAGEVMDYLSMVHHMCKSSDPGSRPTITEVLSHYREVWTLLVEN